MDTQKYLNIIISYEADGTQNPIYFTDSFYIF